MIDPRSIRSGTFVSPDEKQSGVHVGTPNFNHSIIPSLNAITPGDASAAFDPNNFSETPRNKDFPTNAKNAANPNATVPLGASNPSIKQIYQITQQEDQLETLARKGNEEDNADKDDLQHAEAAVALTAMATQNDSPMFVTSQNYTQDPGVAFAYVDQNQMQPQIQAQVQPQMDVSTYMMYPTYAYSQQYGQQYYYPTATATPATGVPNHVNRNPNPSLDVEYIIALEKEKCRNKMQCLEKEISELKERNVENLSRLIVENSKKKDENEQELKKMKEQKGALATELESLRKIHGNVSKTAEHESTAYKDAVAQSWNKSVTLEKETKQLKMKNLELTNEIRVANYYVGEVKKQLENEKKAHKEIKREASIWEKVNAKLKDTNEVLEDRLAFTSKEHADLLIKLDECRQDIDGEETERKNLENITSGLSNELQKANQDAETLKESLEHEQRARIAMEDKTKELESRNAYLQQELLDASARVGDVERMFQSEQRAHIETVTKNSAKIVCLEMTTATLRSDLHKSKAKVNDVSDKLKNQVKMLDDAAVRAEKFALIRVESKAFKDENSRLQSDLKVSQQQVENAKSMLEDKQKLESIKRKETSAMKDRIGDLTKEAIKSARSTSDVTEMLKNAQNLVRNEAAESAKKMLCIEKDFELMKERNAVLTNDLQKAKQRFQDANHKYSHEKKLVIHTRNIVKESEDRISELMRALEEAGENINDLDEKLEHEKQMLNEAVEESSEQISAMEQEAKTLKGSNEELINEVQKTNTNLEDEKLKFKQEMKALNEIVSASLKKISTLENESKALTSSNVELRSEVLKVNRHSGDTSKELERELAVRKEEFENISKQLSGFKTEAVSLKEKNAGLCEELNMTKNEMEKLNTDLEFETCRHNEIKHQMDILESRNRDLTKKLLTIQQSSNDAAKMLVNEQKQFNEANKKISERLRSLEKEKASLQDFNAQLQSELGETHQIVTKASNALENEQNANIESKKEATVLTSKNSQLKKEVLAANGIINDLNNKLRIEQTLRQDSASKSSREFIALQQEKELLMSGLKKRVDELSKSLHIEREAKDALISQSLEERVALDNKANKLKSNATMLDNEIKVLNKKSADTLMKLENEQEVNHKMVKKIETLKEAVKESTKKLEAAHDRLGDTNKALDSERKSYAEVSRTVVALLEKEDVLKAKNAELFTELLKSKQMVKNTTKMLENEQRFHNAASESTSEKLAGLEEEKEILSNRNEELSKELIEIRVSVEKTKNIIKDRQEASNATAAQLSNQCIVLEKKKEEVIERNLKLSKELEVANNLLMEANTALHCEKKAHAGATTKNSEKSTVFNKEIENLKETEANLSNELQTVHKSLIETSKMLECERKIHSEMTASCSRELVTVKNKNLKLSLDLLDDKEQWNRDLNAEKVAHANMAAKCAKLDTQIKSLEHLVEVEEKLCSALESEQKAHSDTATKCSDLQKKLASTEIRQKEMEAYESRAVDAEAKLVDFNAQLNALKAEAREHISEIEYRHLYKSFMLQEEPRMKKKRRLGVKTASSCGVLDADDIDHISDEAIRDRLGALNRMIAVYEDKLGDPESKVCTSLETSQSDNVHHERSTHRCDKDKISRYEYGSILLTIDSDSDDE